MMTNARGWALFVALGLGGLLGTTVATAQVLGQVGNIRTGPEHCGDAAMNLARPYTCVELVVRCDDPLTPVLEAEDRPVQLRVTTPPPGMDVLGTVILGLGGSGRGFYENAGGDTHPEPPGTDMIDRLNAEGYRVIQRAWRDRPNLEPGGWINGSTSLVTSACRYATLLDWIHQETRLHDAGHEAFCVAGQSGGASEIGYALSTYGMDDRIDLAILSGGPPHGRFDGGCDPSSIAWENACNANLEMLGVCPQQGPDDHNCFFQPGTIERNIDSGFDLNPPPDDTPCALVESPVLQANGVLTTGADVDYPQTNTVFLIGEDDCGTAPAMGSPYILNVLGQSTGPARREILPDVGHSVPSFPAGAARVGDTILAADGCVLRH